MLKSFRRLFPRRTMVEIDVERVEPRDAEDLPSTSTTPDREDLAEAPIQPDADGFIQDLREDLGLQRVAHERIAEGLAGVEAHLEPMGRELRSHAESIATSERQVAELVAEFTRTAVARGASMEEAVRALGATGERQAQVLTLLQEQLDRTQQSNEALGARFTELAGGLDTLVASQETQATRTGELVDAVRDQMSRSDLAQRRLFAVAVAMLGVGALGVLAAVVLVLVYAG